MIVPDPPAAFQARVEAELADARRRAVETLRSYAHAARPKPKPKPKPRRRRRGWPATRSAGPRVRVRAKIQPGDGDPRHGTSNGYNNLRCRCPECREANRVYNLKWRHAHGYNLPRDVWVANVRANRVERHGTEGEYTRWGCRCLPCRAASAQARLDRAVRARAWDAVDEVARQALAVR